MMQSDLKAAPLIAALEKYDQLYILGGQAGDLNTGAYVRFRHRDNVQALCFIDHLTKALAGYVKKASYFVAAEWYCDGMSPKFEIRCPQHQVEKLAEVLNACRTSLSCDDMDHRIALDS